MSEQPRFWSRVQKTSTCWLWTGPHTAQGYSRTMHEGRPQPGHRVAYELAKGPIPDGLQLDHLCRNRGCVNPDHLEPVTARENLLRGENLAAQRARQTHCKRGHPLSGGNLKIDTRGFRRCRKCQAIWVAKNKSEMVADMEMLARWIVDETHGKDRVWDHACFECTGPTRIVIEGFRCAPHIAADLLPRIRRRLSQPGGSDAE